MQFQVQKKNFTQARIVKQETESTIKTGEVLLKIERFAYTSNNITYAVTGDRLGYWNFFPPIGNNTEGWGVIPVWGFAEVVESGLEDIPVGDRLFGYFPPADLVKMKPVGIKKTHFIDGSPHRAKMPAGYNLYRRVFAEPNYNKAFDNVRMLLSPLYLTGFCLWDALQDHAWYGAQQVLILSASSKTSIGLGYAIKEDEKAPKIIGLTSERNKTMIKSLSLYDEVNTYTELNAIDSSVPTVLVDMSGNVSVLKSLNTHLGDSLTYCISVGLTHWDNTSLQNNFLKDKSEFFFAPSHIQKRLEEWGYKGFEQKTTAFLKNAAAKTAQWLQFKEVDGLEGLAAVHKDVCDGQIPADIGLIVVQ